MPAITINTYGDNTIIQLENRKVVRIYTLTNNYYAIEDPYLVEVFLSYNVPIYYKNSEGEYYSVVAPRSFKIVTHYIKNDTESISFTSSNMDGTSLDVMRREVSRSTIRSTFVCSMMGYKEELNTIDEEMLENLNMLLEQSQVGVRYIPPRG